MNKIYWSKNGNPEEFPDAKSYWFPFAERLMRSKFRWVVLLYVRFRMIFEARP